MSIQSCALSYEAERLLYPVVFPSGEKPFGIVNVRDGGRLLVKAGEFMATSKVITAAK